jgi:predicted RNase H-related nuclease YkuK (DUF458 family)
MIDKFKKFGGEKIVDVLKYVKDYITKFPETEVMVGTDSQNHGSTTTYCTIIAMYRPGKGGHCIYRKWKTAKVSVRSVRLLAEVWASIEISNLLRDSGVTIKYIDIDINPNPKFKSYEVYSSAKGMVEGLGYECRCKTFIPLVTSMADWVVKS